MADLQKLGYIKISKALTTHGESVYGIKGLTPEYRIWGSIKTRCNNPNTPYYKNYGGRGIKVCPEWEKSYEQFLKDMGRRLNNKYILKRISIWEEFSKKNCKWMLKKYMYRGKRSNITYKGELIIEAAKRLGISRQAISSRLKHKWSIEKAFTKRRTHYVG